MYDFDYEAGWQVVNYLVDTCIRQYLPQNDVTSHYLPTHPKVPPARC